MNMSSACCSPADHTARTGHGPGLLNVVQACAGSWIGGSPLLRQHCTAALRPVGLGPWLLEKVRQSSCPTCLTIGGGPTSVVLPPYPFVALDPRGTSRHVVEDVVEVLVELRGVEVEVVVMMSRPYLPSTRRLGLCHQIFSARRGVVLGWSARPTVPIGRRHWTSPPVVPGKAELT